MTYTIRGLDPAKFTHLNGMSDADLAAHGAIRMSVDAKPGFPCRLTLIDADPGNSVLLLNHVSHEGGPYRASHAIFVTENADTAAHYRDEAPPALDVRVLSLRAFDSAGMMVDAALAQPGEADGHIRRLFTDDRVDHIDAHNAVRGCFAARIDRA